MSTSDESDLGPGSRLADDKGQYECKSVQALRGRESSAKAKWRDEGWEFVSENRGTLRTELNFRRVKPRTLGAYLVSFVATVRRLQPKMPLAWVASGALILVAGTIGVVVVGTQNGSDTPDRSAAPSQPDAKEFLTADNNEEFATLLAVPDYCDETIAPFVAKYGGKTIEFDGSIAHMAKYGGTDTRYDILVAPGNKGPESTVGPAFKFEDVNVFDLNLTGPKIPPLVGEGDRFRFVARVAKYSPKQCLLFLTPVSTTVM